MRDAGCFRTRACALLRGNIRRRSSREALARRATTRPIQGVTRTKRWRRASTTRRARRSSPSPRRAATKTGTSTRAQCASTRSTRVALTCLTGALACHAPRRSARGRCQHCWTLLRLTNNPFTVVSTNPAYSGYSSQYYSLLVVVRNL